MIIPVLLFALTSFLGVILLFRLISIPTKKAEPQVLSMQAEIIISSMQDEPDDWVAVADEFRKILYSNLVIVKYCNIYEHHVITEVIGGLSTLYPSSPGFLEVKMGSAIALSEFDREHVIKAAKALWELKHEQRTNKAAVRLIEKHIKVLSEARG